MDIKPSKLNIEFKNIVKVHGFDLAHSMGIDPTDLCWEISQYKVLEIEIDTNFLDLVQQGKDISDYLDDSSDYRVMAHLYNVNKDIYFVNCIMVVFTW